MVGGGAGRRRRTARVGPPGALAAGERFAVGAREVRAAAAGSEGAREREREGAKSAREPGEGGAGVRAWDAAAHTDMPEPRPISPRRHSARLKRPAR